MSRGPYILAFLFLVLLAGLLTLALQNTQYLKTQALVSVEGVVPEESTVPVDDYTKIEAYCQTQKQAHVVHCGEGYPEDDYHCRVEEGQAIFENCINTVTIEDIETGGVSDGNISDQEAIYAP